MFSQIQSWDAKGDAYKKVAKKSGANNFDMND